ncbi:hypothetical protein, partial [Nocardioides deserti]
AGASPSARAGGERGKGGREKDRRADRDETSDETSDEPAVTASADADPETLAPSASSEAADPADGGLPAWVPLVLVVLLLGAGGAVVVRRRSASAS